MIASGKIFALCRDFLCQSLFIDHGIYDSLRFLSFYAHIVPHQQLMIGQKVQVGNVVGVVADKAGKKKQMPAHVHISLMRIPQTVSFDLLVLKFICNSNWVELLDPLSMIRCEAARFHPKNPWKGKDQATS